jgi:hypothetical protein
MMEEERAIKPSFRRALISAGLIVLTFGTIAYQLFSLSKKTNSTSKIKEPILVDPNN